MRYWLMKSEPDEFSIDDLVRAKNRATPWFGVRNYQARNFMRDEMQEGDPVLFYASNADPSGVTGLATIARAGYPDSFAWRKGHKYFDAASSSANPIWYTVDLAFLERFPGIVSLETLKNTPGLENMVVTRKGSRLSVQTVTPAEYEIVVALGRAATAGDGAATGPTGSAAVGRAAAHKPPVAQASAGGATRKRPPVTRGAGKRSARR